MGWWLLFPVVFIAFIYTVIHLGTRDMEGEG